MTKSFVGTSVILISVILLSCETKNDNITRKSIDTGGVNLSVPIEYKKVIELLEDNVPSIQSLPLGTSFFKESNLSKNRAPLYRLPWIEKYNYIILDTNLEDLCGNKYSPVHLKLPLDSVFNFKGYRYKLPNIGGYESYIVSDTTYSIYNKRHIGKCSNMLNGTLYVFLILYDSIHKNANVIPLQFVQRAGEGTAIWRDFTISPNYIISLNDYGISFKNAEEGEEIVLCEYTIEIGRTGEININRKHNLNK